MKTLWLTLGVCAFLSSCATIQQNIDARAYLAKCKFEYSGFRVTGVTFSSGIIVDAVDFEVDVKITDTTDRDVALDHATLSFFLDKNPILDVAHQPDEYVLIDDLVASAQVMALAAASLLSRSA